ncbi:fatty acyl-AMP ligase [Nucisporomicrobium flavum]|uniref:fatty acyl-AMP ligase n=1 Tax=Nucisporomicrobium flavum TaxID=2785915 RepID=UPI0018F4206A|nr:fatty acyl-AMP ligase [Nucisporomicrobium flavum]
MSRFLDRLIDSARTSDRGLVVRDGDGFARRTWGELHHQARRIAGGLAEAGVGPGSRVAVLCGQPGEVAPLVQAVWLRGAAVTMLQQASPRADPAIWLADTAVALATVRAGLVVAGPPYDPAVLAGTPVRTVPLAALAAGPDTDPVEVGEDAAALLQLSSGSTGAPKAIVVKHRNLYANIDALLARFRLTREADTAVSWLPLFHDMGMIAFMAQPMMAGIELVKASPLDFLGSPVLWAEMIARFRGTFTAAPNFAYVLLSRRLERIPDGRFDLSSMRYAINGAEPVDYVAMQRFTAEAGRFGWPGTALVGAYGMAEAVLGVSAPEPGIGLGADRVDPDALELTAAAVPHRDGRPLATLGRPFDGIEVRVVAENGEPVGARQVGELEIRGEAVTETYLTTEGEFAARGADGWLPTGDVGYRTDDGELVICGRRKDVIIVAGRNIFPTEIERAAEQVPGIRPGGVVAVSIDAGRPDEGFAVIAEADPRDAGRDAGELRRTVGRRVFDAVGATPRQVLVVAAGRVPKTSSGKLRRGQARELLP